MEKFVNLYEDTNVVSLKEEYLLEYYNNIIFREKVDKYIAKINFELNMYLLSCDYVSVINS